MTLTTHAVAGSVLGAIAWQNPALGALAGFCSHFLLDAVPHWDYKLGSAHEDKVNPLNSDISASGATFIWDLGKIAIDFFLGIVLIYLLFYQAPFPVLIGAFIGGLFAIAPDPLQFVYMKFRREPLVSLQKFHLFMHAKTHLKDRPMIGIILQVALICTIAFLIRLFIGS